MGGSSGFIKHPGEFYYTKMPKCANIYRDVQTVVGEGLSISAINFVVGIKPTSAKLAESENIQHHRCIHELIFPNILKERENCETIESIVAL